VWILILLSWAALFLLILHDATKDDCNGSAVSIAAKKLGALARWALSKAPKFPKALPSYTLSQASMPQVIMSQPSMPQASMSQTSEAPPLAPDDDAVKSENIKPENTPSRKKWGLAAAVSTMRFNDLSGNRIGDRGGRQEDRAWLRGFHWRGDPANDPEITP